MYPKWQPFCWIWCALVRRRLRSRLTALRVLVLCYCCWHRSHMHTIHHNWHHSADSAAECIYTPPKSHTQTPTHTHTNNMRITDIRREASSSRRQRLLFDWTIAICSVVLLMSATSALADGNVPDDLLRSVDTAAEIDDDDRPRTTANNECGGRCACLGEYMDCANVQLSRFEERLPDWIRVLWVKWGTLDLWLEW